MSESGATASRRVIAVAASVIAVAAVATVVAMSSAREPTTPTAAPLPTASAERPTDAPSSSPSSTPVDNESGVDKPEVDPRYGDTVVDEATNAPANFDGGAEVRLVSVTPTEVSGTGIGAANGPAQKVVIELANGGDEPLDVSAVVVNGFTGDAAIPAIAAESSESRPFSGSLRAGSTMTAVFVFGVESTSEPFRVTVSLSADSGSVVLERR